jgi:site-specific DNA-cytosine methylase
VGRLGQFAATVQEVEHPCRHRGWLRCLGLGGNDIPAQLFKCSCADRTAEESDPWEVTAKVGPIDLLLASPECTSHSVAKGKAPRCEKSRQTAFEVIRYAQAFRPRWLVVENVPQMLLWFRFQEWLDQIGSTPLNREVAREV